MRSTALLTATYILALAGVFAILGYSAAAPELAQAQGLYQGTRYRASLDLLLHANAKDPQVLRLMGQNYFMLGDFKKAAEVFEQAAKMNPEDAESALWAGRAFGRRAETSGPFTAPGYASKARQYLEKAVALDPSNREAAGDLFDYYIDAPSYLGGGEKKAEALAAKVAERDPAEGHYYQAQLADRHKEYDTAEQHFRKALDLAPRQAGRFLDLAKFLAGRGSAKESEALFDEATKLAPANPKILYERARAYIHGGRNLIEARKLLEQYIKSPLTPADPPRAEAQALLNKIGS